MNKKYMLEIRSELGKAWTALEHCKERMYLYNGSNEYSNNFSNSLFEIQENILSIRASLVTQLNN